MSRLRKMEVVDFEELKALAADIGILPSTLKGVIIPFSFRPHSELRVYSSILSSLLQVIAHLFNSKFLQLMGNAMVVLVLKSSFEYTQITCSIHYPVEHVVIYFIMLNLTVDSLLLCKNIA
jgi:hypothetical protein